MISTEKAAEIVSSIDRIMSWEELSFTDCEGRVLFTDVRSDINMPPFNRAAVDGYACHRSDLDSPMEIVETIRAGMEPAVIPGKDQCSRIMTGAIVPDGCDFVFMVEDSKLLAPGKVIYTGKSLKPNLSPAGEDVKTGDIVLRKGKLIRPQDVAVLAAVGCINVKVSRRPLVGIISTGDELVEPWQKPGRPEIRNSNAYQLAAQAKRSGAATKYYGIAPDDEAKTLKMVDEAINDCDVVLLTGGVSMGDFDFVPDVLRKAGAEILFDHVNVQPGKPTTLALHPGAVIFGLPGNPVSAFVQFEVLVRPLIYKMMGCTWKPVEMHVKMAENFERRQSARAAWIPVTINEKHEAVPVDYHGSAHIAAFPYADGIIRMSPGINLITKGEVVVVRQI